MSKCPVYIFKLFAELILNYPSVILLNWKQLKMENIIENEKKEENKAGRYENNIIVWKRRKINSFVVFANGCYEFLIILIQSELK